MSILDLFLLNNRCSRNRVLLLLILACKDIGREVFDAAYRIKDIKIKEH